MDSARGKTIMNYFYSWGAAVVILGTLFKLTHLPGADIMLFVGMGTEVIVFLFSAFERPFEIEEEGENSVNTTGGVAGQSIIINGSIMAGGSATGTAPVATDTPAAVVATTDTTTPGGPVVIGGGTPAVIGGTGIAPVVAPGNIEEMDKATEEYVEGARTYRSHTAHLAAERGSGPQHGGNGHTEPQPHRRECTLRGTSAQCRRTA